MRVRGSDKRLLSCTAPLGGIVSDFLGSRPGPSDIEGQWTNAGAVVACRMRVEWSGLTQGYAADGLTSDELAIAEGLTPPDNTDVTLTLFTVDSCGNLAGFLAEHTFNTGD